MLFDYISAAWVKVNIKQRSYAPRTKPFYGRDFLEDQHAKD